MSAKIEIFFYTFIFVLKIGNKPDFYLIKNETT